MNQPAATGRRSTRLALGAITFVLAFWPLVQNRTAFQALFYFQDEWDLIDLWDKTGFAGWTFATFAENFVPVFKLFWGGAIVLFDGDYFALVLLLWLTHALNALLVYRISCRFTGDAWAAAAAGMVFGLAWVNYETLGWTVQWSAVLSLTFFLIAVDRLAAWQDRDVPAAWGPAVLIGLCSALSALCFSRGVLSGLVLAAWMIFARPRTLSRTRQFAAAMAGVVPAVAVALWIVRHSSGNHQHLREALQPMLNFALHYYAQAPLRTLWSNETPGVGAIAMLALLKSLVFLAALRIVPTRWRPALTALWLFELGNALLLGLGRYHTGLGASGSSRYQYGALAMFLPACAVVLGGLLQRVPNRLQLRMLLAAAVLVITVWLAQAPWPQVMSGWSASRGGDLRRFLFVLPPDQVPAHATDLPWMTNARARQLVARYHLH